MSELKFEHGAVILRCAWNPSVYALGSLNAVGGIAIHVSGVTQQAAMFTHFLPLSEIAHLLAVSK
jgi:hypothetical protein